jgi:L-histidine Nalpha-methyltransferase
MAPKSANAHRILRLPRAVDALVQETVSTLSHTPKELLPKWFYDEHGSQLFDAICEVPEYYLTRTELAIMQEDAAAMAQAIGPNATLIEFGSGTSLKTRLLLDHLESPAVYVPIDIAQTHLLDAASAITRDYPYLNVAPLCADFTRPIALPSKAVIAGSRRVVYFPGSTIGNFDYDAARELLESMRDLVGETGAILIGVDLRKEIGTLERAYDDSARVTAKFNLNALRHINRELDADFALDQFEHQSVWVEDQSRIEMRLISTSEQTVHLGDDTIHFDRGEFIRTECCHKYSLESFASLASEAGLEVRRVWLDDAQRFSVQELTRA